MQSPGVKTLCRIAVAYSTTLPEGPVYGAELSYETTLNQGNSTPFTILAVSRQVKRVVDISPGLPSMTRAVSTEAGLTCISGALTNS